MTRKKPAKEPVKKKAPCHFCQKEVDEDDMFCHGCKHVICGECDVIAGAYGRGHSVEDHRREPGGDEW